MPFSLTPLPYATDALEPFCDALTVDIHHGKHQKAYVDNLNKLLEGHPALGKKSLHDLLTGLDELPEEIRQKMANQAGGVWNHEFFWLCMVPPIEGGGGAPAKKFGDAINTNFGGFADFQSKFKESALALFGSGWTYLVSTKAGGLEIRNYEGQDCPIRHGAIPLLGLDVWEHAYYLKFQNRRPDWVDSWWHVVDWARVEARWLNGAGSGG